MTAPATPPPAPKGKSPLFWILAVGCLGMLGLLVGVGGMGAWFYLKKPVPVSNQVTPVPVPYPTGGGGGGSPVPIPVPIPTPTPGSKPNTDDSIERPTDMPAPKDTPQANPGIASLIGGANTVDLLDVPIGLPKGMLPFMQGVDKLGAHKYAEAITLFSQAINEDPENSNYYTARGSSYVVAQQMEQGLPDLQRAIKLNPKNTLPSRMARLAYLMMGEQLAASKYYGHGSTQSIDFLITEVGVGYGSRNIAKKNNFAMDPHDRIKSEAAEQKLPTVAGMVAQSYRSGEDKSVQAVFALGIGQFQAKDYSAARRSFNDVILKFPYDWTSRYYYARCLLEVGDPELARRELTYVLCWKRYLPEAYVARALCAARQNDPKRAVADLKIAMKLDPAKSAEAQQAVAQVLERSKEMPPGNDSASWDALGQAARSEASLDSLVAGALTLRQSVNARRLRFDETYQSKLYDLSTAVRADPQNADKIADLAQFLRDNFEVLGLHVVPNAPARFFRRQSQQTLAWETDLAFQLVNEGIRANPNHARCWAIKSAMLLHSYNRCEEAEHAAHTAIRCDSRSILGHMALSDCYHEYAARWRAKAAALRAPKPATRNVRIVDQRGNYLRTDTETYYIPASAAELAEAAECDRKADANERREQVCLSNALNSAKGTSEEPFYQALMAYMKRDYATARPWLEKAVAANPNDARMRRYLAYCLRALKLEDEYLEEYSRAIDLMETTAEVWLHTAWQRIDRTAWESAKTALLKAREHDPSDARIYAYLGILTEFETKNAAYANAAFKTALAQEEARARMNGTKYSGAGAAGPLTPEVLGLSMMLRLKLGKSYFKTQPELAASYYMETIQNEARLSEWGLADNVNTAMLPNPDRGQKDLNAPPPLVSILKNNRIYAGQALLNAGKSAEAAAQFAAAENFANRLPAGGTAYLEFEMEPQYVPFRVSSMPMYVKVVNAQALLQQGKRDEARIELQQVRYYLANQTMDQRNTPDDPISVIYQRLAPQVGLR